MKHPLICNNMVPQEAASSLFCRNRVRERAARGACLISLSVSLSVCLSDLVVVEAPHDVIDTVHRLNLKERRVCV